MRLLPALVPALRQALPASALTQLSGASLLQVAGQRFLALAADELGAVAFIPLAADSLRITGAAQSIDLRPLLARHDDSPGDLPRSGELDLEGICSRPGGIWTVGSCSLKRPRIRKKHRRAGRAAVLRRLSKVTPASGKGRTHADHAFSLDLRLVDGTVVPTLRTVVALREPLLKLKPLRPFADVPSKDNGLDIEGIALCGPHGWLGLRGPVLRGWALLVRTSPDFRGPELFPVDLDGGGIRGLTVARPPGLPPRLLLLSGPPTPTAGAYQIWSWVPPTGKQLGRARRLCTLHPPPGAKPEALVYRPDPQTGRPHALVIMDGPAGGHPSLVELPPPT